MLHSMLNSTIPEKQPERTLLAVQMLCDAARDPKPAADADATRSSIASTVRQTTARIIAHTKAGISDRWPTEDEKVILTQAMKFNFESRFAVLDAASDATYRAKFEDIQNAALQGNREAKAMLGRIGDAEGLKQHVYYAEMLRQCDELARAAKFLKNGELNELYFGLLLRHAAMSTADRIVQVQSTTARQDAPHDGMLKIAQGRLSHDAVVRGLQDGRTFYVQLKIGRGTDGGARVGTYHPDIVTISPFRDAEAGEDKKEYNREIRSEALQGLAELKGLLGELVSGNFYEGSVQVIDRHTRIIRTAFTAKLAGRQALRAHK
jgi:hypothetical protein